MVKPHEKGLDDSKATVQVRPYNARTKDYISVDFSEHFFDIEGKSVNFHKDKDDGKMEIFHFDHDGLLAISLPDAKVECETLRPRYGEKLWFRVRRGAVCCLDVPYYEIAECGLSVHVNEIGHSEHHREPSPLKGISVEVALIQEASPAFDYDALVLTKETNDCGIAEFANLQANCVYRVTAAAPRSYNYASPAGGVWVQHLCGSEMEKIVFNLQRCLNYQRLVLVNECGEPWESATIELCREGEKRTRGLLKAKVDNGLAVFDDLQPGQYSVSGRTKNGEMLLLAESSLIVNSGPGIKVIQATAVEAVTYHGRITTQDGAALPYEKVQFLKPGSNDLLATVFTDQDGYYSLTCGEHIVDIATQGVRTRASSEEQPPLALASAVETGVQIYEQM
jgi:hypothetical protein